MLFASFVLCVAGCVYVPLAWCLFFHRPLRANFSVFTFVYNTIYISLIYELFSILKVTLLLHPPQPTTHAPSPITHHTPPTPRHINQPINQISMSSPIAYRPPTDFYHDLTHTSLLPRYSYLIKNNKLGC